VSRPEPRPFWLPHDAERHEVRPAEDVRDACVTESFTAYGDTKTVLRVTKTVHGFASRVRSMNAARGYGALLYAVEVQRHNADLSFLRLEEEEGDMISLFAFSLQPRRA
jgi:hypothetical protein